MKKKATLLAISILSVICGLHAQTEKGSVYLGGSINFSSIAANVLPNSYPQTYSQTQLTVSPSVAWAYKNNRFVGFSLSYVNVRAADSLFIDRQNSVAVSVFLRQYKLLLKGFYLFAHESFSAGFGHTNDVSYGFNSFQLSLGVSPGLAYNIAKHLQLEVALANIIYARETYLKYSGLGVRNNNHSNSFNFGSSLEGSSLGSFAFGLRYFL